MPPLWQLLAALLVTLAVHGVHAASRSSPVIISDGGASCQRPTATLEAFQLAIDQGADFLAMTVVSTKDGEFVVRPSLMLGGNTNVGDLRSFNSLKRSLDLGNGRKAAGYLASDMTLEQVKTLWATQSFKERDQSMDKNYRVPTFTEALDLVRKNVDAGKHIGVFVQILDPAYHAAANLASYTQVLAALLSAGFKADFAKRVKIQSYDLQVLTDVADQMQSLGLPSRDSLVWMIHCTKKVTDAQLAAFAKIGAAIAPEKEQLQDLTFAEECGRLVSPPCWKTGTYCTGKLKQVLTTAAEPLEKGLLARAHAAGLKVYPFTFRNEGRFMAVDFASDMSQELNWFAGPHGLGVDGVYTDCTRSTSEWLSLMAAGATFAGLPNNAAVNAASAAATTANNAATAFTDAASKAARSVKAAAVKTWAFGIVAGAAILLLVLIGLMALRARRRRAYQYRAWKEAGLSQGPDADLPVSTGAVWGLQKNTWSSGASEMEAEAAAAPASRASSIASKASKESGRSGSRDSRKLKTYSGMLDSYAQNARR